MTETYATRILYTKKVPGQFRPLFLDGCVGALDYKRSQVVIDLDNSITTPWINGKLESLAEYESKIYSEVDHAIAPIVQTVIKECKELELIRDRGPKETAEIECQGRAADMEALEKKKNKERESEILLHLASLKGELEMISVSLSHHLQRAGDCNQKHIYAYWGGILKAAGRDGNNDMPFYSERKKRPSFAKEVFYKNFNIIMKHIDDELERRSINESDQTPSQEK